MIIRWTEDATFDRQEIFAFIAVGDVRAAYRIDGLLGAAVDRLEAHPFMGKEGAMPGTREVVPHPRYRIVYEVLDQVVVILALVHTSRQWPPDPT